MLEGINIESINTVGNILANATSHSFVQTFIRANVCTLE